MNWLDRNQKRGSTHQGVRAVLIGLGVLVLIGLVFAAQLAAQDATADSSGRESVERSWPQIEIAEFRSDGELSSSKFVDADTSLAECQELHKLMNPQEGAVFRGKAPGRFGELDLQVTDSGGGGTATIRMGEFIVGSAVFVSGQNPESDDWMLKTFRESMLKIDIVKNQATPGAEPFKLLNGTKTRPFIAYVIWPWKVVEGKQSIVRELCIAIGQSMYFQPGSKRPRK